MAKKPIPFITEYCPHCQHEVKIKGTMRWHQCPVCGNFIMPCSMCRCDKMKCASECPLRDIPKPPVGKIGNHTIESVYVNKDSIALIFDYEDCSNNINKMAYKIYAYYLMQQDEYQFIEVLFDLYLSPIGSIKTSEHLTNREIACIKRKLRRLVDNIKSA